MHMPYWDELQYNDVDEVNGPDDVNLPPLMHHMQAKAELDLLTRAGTITGEEAKQVMDEWKASQEMSVNVRLRAAIDELETREVIADDQADEIRQALSG